ncbi:MAG: serine/threonine protein kinase, partial [Planctomycetota bacterium]
MSDEKQPAEPSHTEPADARPETPKGPVPAGRLPAATKIGHYSIKRVIAAGGMGVVYEAIQEHPRRTVALKIMKQGIASRSALRRFEYESQILARLRHPGIAQVYEAGMHEDPDGVGQVPYFAMEYVAAARDIIDYATSNDLSTRERLELFAKVCEAVYHGHQKGIVHRDLKPPNILVDASGQPKIIDFGVARSTDSDLAVTTLQTNVGQLVGTMQYMSPEQIDADPLNIDTRSDVFALGVVLYRLLTGRLPYDVGKCSIYEATRIIREEQPARPSITNPGLGGDVETIILHALEKDRQRRYQSALELALDIRRYLSSHAILARPPSTLYQIKTFAKRNTVLVAGAAGVFLALVLGVIAFSWQASIARSQRDVAEAAQLTAERRFDQVRALAGEFMFDFHDAIQTLDGAMPARELVVTTALEYLDSLAAEAGDNLDLKRDLASAYDRVGDIHGGLRNPSLGDTAGALENFRTALALRQEVTEADPDDLDTLKALSTSHIRIGDMLTNTSDVAGALGAYREALAIREEVARRDPEYRLNVSTAMLEVGGALDRTGDLSAGRDYCERALALRKLLLAQDPENKKVRR